jgi:hypothetical protein
MCVGDDVACANCRPSVVEPPPGFGDESSRSAADALETLDAQALVFVGRVRNAAASADAAAPAVKKSGSGRAGAKSKKDAVKAKPTEENATVDLALEIRATAERVRAAAARDAVGRHQRQRRRGGAEGRYVAALREARPG